MNISVVNGMKQNLLKSYIKYCKRQINMSIDTAVYRALSSSVYSKIGINDKPFYKRTLYFMLWFVLGSFGRPKYYYDVTLGLKLQPNYWAAALR